MTFAVVLASRTAIWACTDRQLTDRRNPGRSSTTGVKITCIACPDGLALLAYAGVGRVSDTQVSQWAYRVLCGHKRTVEKSLERIADAAQRRLLPHARRAGGHLFVAAAIRDRKHYVYAIDIFKKPLLVNRFVPKTRTHVRFGITGSGMLYAQRHEVLRFKRIARMMKQYERGKLSPKFIASQLAALNVAVAGHAHAAGDLSVSRESIVVHRDPKKGGQHWIFDRDGNADRSGGIVIPSVGHGMPTSSIVEALWGDLQKHMRALPANATREEWKAHFRASTNLMTLDGKNIPAGPDEEFR